jgi:N-methylhydantoinase A
MTAHIRIGIDTGGTFTDVVAFDETTGELTVTKTPSTPADPAQGFMAGLQKMLGLLDEGMDAIASVSHGTTIATNQLLEGDAGRLGHHQRGVRVHPRDRPPSVPDGYGNSYLGRRTGSCRRPGQDRGRADDRLARGALVDEARAVEVARWFAERGSTRWGLPHSYANPEHEERMAAGLAASNRRR